LTGKLAAIGADVLIDVLPVWERGEIVPVPQDDSLATYAPQIRSEAAVIDWTLPATEVWRRVRAYNPWPIATTTVAGERLRVLEAWPLEDEPDVPAGAVLPILPDTETPPDAGFAVRCGSGVLAIAQAQRAGKRAISGRELLRGWRELLGQRLPS
jgi:methionyl-tRNA formyltransferase